MISNTRRISVSFALIIVTYICSVIIYTFYHYNEVGQIRQNWKQAIVEVNAKPELISKFSDDIYGVQSTLVMSMFVSSFFFLILLLLGKRLIDKAQKKLEVERQARTHVARLSAIGQMSGSIAHEINNPLAILSGTSQMIQMCLNKDPIPKDILTTSANTIKDSVERIADIVSGLRNLTRDDHKEKFSLIEFDSLLSEIMAICKDRYSRFGINIISPSETGFLIEGQRIQIAQVLIILLNNSVDAIKEEKKKWIKIEVLQNKKETTISVIDSGPGISKDTKDKLMTPFFTTKKPGEGTGVNLSISKNIIDKHNGKFFYDDTSENTKFVIQLPKRKI
jgi:C4-dicarboxylate-specific signal transduction histidine kinase